MNEIVGYTGNNSKEEREDFKKRWNILAGGGQLTSNSIQFSSVYS